MKIDQKSWRKCEVALSGCRGTATQLIDLLGGYQNKRSRKSRLLICRSCRDRLESLPGMTIKTIIDTEDEALKHQMTLELIAGDPNG